MGADILNVKGSAKEAGAEVQTGGKTFKCAYYDDSSPAAAHIVKGSLVLIGPDYGSTLYNPKVAVVATTSIHHEFGVALADLTEAGWYWFQTKGDIDTLCVEGTTDIGIGDALKPVNGENYAVVDHATVLTASAVAVAKEAFTTNGESTIEAYLLGRRATVA